MAKTQKQAVGKLGEDIAVNFLKKNGYTLKGRNLLFSPYELDIVVEDKEYVVFVEVKTRTYFSLDHTSNFGSPGKAVTAKKRNNTIKAAKAYISEKHPRKQPRIDVIEVFLSNDPSRPAQINHIISAFDVRGNKH